MPRPSKESPQALQAYHDYADMGPGRSLDALVNRYQTASGIVPTKRLKTLCDWSVAFNWQDRLMDREARLAEQSEAKVAQEREEYKRQRLQEARALRSAGAALLQRLLKKTEGMDKMTLPELLDTLPQVIRAIEVGHKEERLELGEATERPEVIGDRSRPVRMEIDEHGSDRLAAVLEVLVECGALPAGPSIPPSSSEME